MKCKLATSKVDFLRSLNSASTQWTMSSGVTLTKKSLGAVQTGTSVSTRLKDDFSIIFKTNDTLVCSGILPILQPLDFLTKFFNLFLCSFFPKNDSDKCNDEEANDPQNRFNHDCLVTT